MKSYLKKGAIAIILLLGSVFRVEAGVIQVYFSDNDARYTLYTLESGQAEYIPLDKVSQIFRLIEAVDPVDGRVVLRNDEKTVSFFPDQDSVIANRRSYFIDEPPRKFEGVLMIPLQFLVEILPLIYDQEITWDSASRTLLVGVQNLEVDDLFTSPYGDYTRVVAELNQTVSYKIIEKLPSMLIFELPHAALMLSQNPLQVNSRSVEQVKVIDSFGSTQIIVRLGDDFVRYTHQFLEDPARLLIDIYNTQQAVLEGTQDIEEIVEEDIVLESDQMVPIAARPFSLQTIVIDAGHGGSDFGILLAQATESAPAIFEKDITLEIAKMLAIGLQQRFGVRVVLTREGDDFVSAGARATVANSNRADAFISLHVNNAFSRVNSGFEAYIMDYGSLELPPGYETLGSQSQVLDYAQAKYTPMSSKLAKQIVAAYNNRNNGSGGAVKSAPFFTLKGATMPAVHIEIGYSSNQNNQTRILQTEFQQLLVAAITDGIAAFKKQAE